MIKVLNKNNFFIWKGEFDSAPFEIVANDDNASLVKGASYIEIYPLLNDVASYGLNPLSLEFTLQDNIANPATWDAVAKKIIYYPPADVEVGQVREIKYRVKDTIGNVSNEATVSIAISDRATSWRGYAPSYSCVKVGGDNTGIGGYAQLEKYYIDDNSAYIPQALKPNVDGDANYIPPSQNLSACPLPNMNKLFRVYNNVVNPTTWVVAVELWKAGVVKAFFVGSYPTPPQSAQPKSTNVESDTYDQVKVLLVNIISPCLLTLSPGNAGSAEQIKVVDPLPDEQQQIVFDNVTLGDDFAADLTLNLQI